MESDRELLELAAYAAGYQVNFDEPVNGWYPNGYDEYGDVEWWWNPLTDGRDSLSIVVKLELIVGHDAYDRLAYAQVRNPHFSANEFYGGTKTSPESAIKRAIVRAAAEIGRRMKDADKERK